MFFPQEMTEIELVVPSNDLLEVTKMIGKQGIFQQVDSAYLSSSKAPGQAPSWQERVSAYSAMERRIQSLFSTLSLNEGQPPKEELQSMVDLDGIRPTVETIEKEVKDVTDQLTASRKKIEQLETIRQQLESLSDIDIDVSSMRNHRYLFSILGTIPADNIARLQTSLSRIPFVFVVLRQDPQKSVVWLAGTQNNSDVLERAARSAYLSPLSLPTDYQGTPAEIIQTVHTDVAEEQKKTAELNKTLAQLSEKYKAQLRLLYWNVHISRLLADAIVRFGQLRYTYVIVGWIPSSYLEVFQQRLKKVSKDALLEAFPAKRTDKEQDVPVSLANPGFFRPFQLLTTTYARPLYNEIDPTPFIAILFPLLFGAMFGDVGQGLVLALLGWLLTSRRVKAMRGLASLGPIITACGVVATIFGFLYGSFFGYEDVIPALWIRPTTNILNILIYTVIAGVFLLTFGFLVSIYNAYQRRDWGTLFFDHYGLSGLILYWSLVGLGAGALVPNFPIPSAVFVIGIVIGVVGVGGSEIFKHLVEGHRPLLEGGAGSYAIQAFFELFETFISFISNTLSFMRVGAFAVAHGTLSSVFFILGNLVSPGHGIGYWLIFLLGNIFIVGFEGLIVGIQTMRLSYYEFFGKFFTGGGRRYEPLALQPAENEG
jgi:V/A-type H+-transporting ATPase subunit I